MRFIIDVTLTDEGAAMSDNDVCDAIFDILAASDDTVIASIDTIDPEV